MLLILLVSGLLTGLSPWGASQEASPREEPALPWTVVTLNESCRDQVLQHVSAIILRLLRLDRPPRFTADATSQVQESWAKEVAALPSLSSRRQHLIEISFNQTLLSQSGSCIQISHHITLEDLGWQSWVLHPKAFVFTECLGCHCHQKDGGPPLWIKECHLRDPGTWADLDTQQRRCCRPRRTPLAFAFLKEDGSLVLRPLRLVHDCNGQP